jgi:hypothetical protein
MMRIGGTTATARRAITTLAAVVAVVAVPSTAAASVIKCGGITGEPVGTIRASGTSCAVARAIADSEYWYRNHWISIRLTGTGTWHVTWHDHQMRYFPIAFFRASNGRGWVTWEEGP